jgi:hypothetical protein
VLGIGYLAVFASALAYLCFNRCVELIGASRAGMGIHLMPAFGSILAVLFLGERLHLFHLAGLGFIATGIALTMLAAPLSAHAEGVKVQPMLNTEVTSTGQPIVLPRGYVRVITSTSKLRRAPNCPSISISIHATDI